MGDTYFEKAAAKFAAIAAEEEKRKAEELDRYLVLLAKRALEYAHLRHMFDEHSCSLNALKNKVLYDKKRRATRFTIDFWSIQDIIESTLLECRKAIKQFMDDNTNDVIEYDCGKIIGDGYVYDRNAKDRVRYINCSIIRIVLTKRQSGQIAVKNAYPINE